MPFTLYGIYYPHIYIDIHINENYHHSSALSQKATKQKCAMINNRLLLKTKF